MGHVSIDHDAEMPVYLQLAALLRARIESGEFTRRMPSLKSVEQEYGVAHGTTEKAFAVLRTEGIIRSVIGRGYFVVQRKGPPPGR